MQRRDIKPEGSIALWVHRVHTFTKRLGRFALSNLLVAWTAESIKCDEIKQT